MLNKERINLLKKELEIFKNTAASISDKAGRKKLLTGTTKTEIEILHLQQLCRLYKTMFYRYQEVLELLTEE